LHGVGQVRLGHEFQDCLVGPRQEDLEHKHSLCVHRFRVKLSSLAESCIVESTTYAGARGTGLRGGRSRHRPLEPDLGNASVGRHRMLLQV
jgi:hypothetical protein